MAVAVEAMKLMELAARVELAAAEVVVKVRLAELLAQSIQVQAAEERAGHHQVMVDRVAQVL